MSDDEGVTATGRARRKTAKRVNYAKEQEFSDQDVFEDSEEEAAPVAPKRKPGRPRKSKGAATSGAGPSSAPTMAAMEEEDDTEYASRQVYTEKGYDPSLPPIRERFPFLPEYEEDGSPKIELIVGRRAVDEKEDSPDDEEAVEKLESDDDEPRATRRRSSKKNPSPTKNESGTGGPVEYEYLVKYKGRSYLHLEWKTGADLESMNKSAKGIYRRWLKKLQQGVDEDLENPEFDPSYVVPEKIIDEADQEITVELTDKELLKWEKEREKELAEEDDDDDDDEKMDDEATDDKPGEETPKEDSGEKESDGKEKDEAGEAGEEEKKDASDADDWGDEDVDYTSLSMDKLRSIVNRDGAYYPVVKGSDNPYRDGYVKEPPKKPRASYLFFQNAMRSYYQKKNPAATQAELMKILGEAWGNMSDEERSPFLELAQEEAQQYDKEKVLLEKAQKPNEVWQPMRRCLLVLERLAKDSFADIFLEPVDMEEFPDYEEFIDSPMDLGTIRTRLQQKKYQAPEQFARDMRRVWNNCKIYNQHGSAIWHVADYMSKQFERLYHAWVLEFRERYLRWADPRARPWEHSCRQHDGKCGTSDDQMVLCDHCDAMYGFKCVTPPLKKAPKKAWHCPDCKPKLKSVKGMRMLSAVAENAARKRAELGDLPMKKIKQTMYLVKWAGLGYEFCTWETREDINDPALINQFHRLNNTFPDEADMPEEVIESFLKETKHVNAENAGGISCIPSLRTQLYAQSRAFQFIKFGLDTPDNVCSECGPKTKAANMAWDDGANRPNMTHPREVVECLTDIVFRVSRGQSTNRVRSNTSLPPCMAGEYDAIIPVTSKGLMMNVGEIHGSVAFLGYRTFPDGSKGPAERANLIRNVGDKIIAVDGICTIGKSFKDVINILRESGNNKFAFMRFLENRFSICDSSLASVGSVGKYAIEELQKKFKADRQRMVVHRTQELIEEEEPLDQSEDEEDAPEKDSDDESEGSEGEFQPDSDIDDDEVAQKNVAKTDVSVPEKPKEEALAAEVKPVPVESVQETVAKEEAKLDGPVYKQETTRSLGFQLLDVDLGYSSDEGGDEDCAYYLDGVDSTFTCMEDLSDLVPAKKPILSPKGKAKKEEKVEPSIPARQNEFSAQGERSKLAAAVALSTKAPKDEDFENFPYPAKSAENPADEKLSQSPSPTKTKRSTVKVEQISVSTGEVLHVWANVESAAATLQLPLNQLKQVLRGEYDEEYGDEVGGYKWGYAMAGAKVTAGNDNSSRGGGGKKAKEAWLEFRDKLYDPSEPHHYKNGNRLRDYQVDGVNWLASTWYKRQGCILADEMGLGKTVQIVCYIEHLFRVEKIRRPFLIVVPLSTIEHWRREIEGWTDMVCCVYHDRQRVWRDVLREYEWYYKDRPHTAEFLKFDVLVTTYDTLIGDFDVVSQIPFRVAVVDEAHRLRNQKGKLLECMREISAKGTMQYGFQSRVLMSGTPLQNDLTELWTLLNFIEPFKFPDLDDFIARFGNMANREQVESLQKMISPFMLRRVKEDVAKDIPAKEETVIDVELTSIQKTYYRAIFEHNHAFLNMGASRQNAPKLMNIQMELRKVCNHPFLLDGVEHRETERQYREFMDNGKFDDKGPEEQQRMLNEHGYIMTSGKMVLMDKLLPKLRQEGHKVLIFSQMVKMLDLISEYCEFRKFPYERLDGRIRGTERQKAIDRFEREKDSFIFLLSTRAGGVGINLTAADICILFDSDWNPQNDIQAQARCHRIGQTKDVRIYRLVTSRSFEQEMFDRASRKLGLEQAVLGTFEKEKEDDKPSHEEMEQLLKRGAYALLEDDNDQKTKEFCADDIENILAKRTRTRVVEGAKTASWLNKQGMVVSKSKFTTEDGEQLDMDDPLFWQKVMPDFVTPSILAQKLNDLEAEIEGKVKGPGRGRGRKKKTEETPKKEAAADKADGEEKKGDNGEEAAKEKEPESAKKEADEDDMEGAEALLADETLEDISEDEDGGKDGKSSRLQLSRTNIRKINKFMSDLKSMMENILEEDDDEAMSKDEKNVCQKLLLTISVKEKIFSEDQRHLAKVYLKRLEGDRRRRCRTSEQHRFQPGADDEPTSNVVEELMIRGKKRRKRRKRVDGELVDPDLMIEEPAPKRRKRGTGSGGAYVGEDGYLHHSDSEADWSDVAEDLYDPSAKKSQRISRKEANRRRQWATGDDAATAAGRPWPTFPRHLVKDVLATVLDDVIKYDEEEGGGVFSVPVPKDEFPEYYEQIKRPMDYGTMRTKLENGDYRSAQAMQKDFILILQNCRQFNAPSSDIVKEAREQHLMRPKILKEAAKKHNLFLAEDGTVLEIFDEEPKVPKKKGKKKKGAEDDGAEADAEAEVSPKKKKGKKKAVDGEEDEDAPKKASKNKKKKKKADDEEEDDEISEGEEDAAEKPRVKTKATAKSGDATKGKKKRKRAPEPEADDDDGAEADIDATPAPKKKRAKKGDKPIAKKRTKKEEAAEAETISENGDKSPESVPIFLDLARWKQERSELGKTFKEARDHFTKHGRWSLPEGVDDESFPEIALATLSKMDKSDKYSVFTEAVTDEDAPGYSDVVKNPMDFGSMREKIEEGMYGVGSEGAGALFDDFLLVFDNCYLYNGDDSEVTEEAARLFALLPEAFVSACIAASKQSK